jgi:ketosteroid isomerase-like protein
MTRDMAELIRRLADALSRRDIDALMNCFVPDAALEALRAADERLEG